MISQLTAFNRFAGWRPLLVGLLALVMSGLGASARATGLSKADEQNVRATVVGQLAAFAADNANLAFSYAAPNVRKSVGSAANFTALVRDAYPVVYRPATVAFLKPESRDGQVIQRVQMQDAAGEDWLAVYSLRRAGKRWLITGCVVITNKGRMA